MRISRFIGSAIVAIWSFSLLGQETPKPTSESGKPALASVRVDTNSGTQSPNSSAQATPTNSDALQPTTGQAAPPASKLNVDNASYVIGAEDSLQITVWREPTLSGNFPVRPDGMISMVLLGDLPAAGMTPTQLSGDITQRLRKFVQDPSVTVQVMAANSQRIYLIGEVGHVGAVALSAGMTPLQAIAAAGGLSNFANSKHIYILRGSGASQQKIPFNYKQALKGDNHQNIVLRPGDTIVVP